MPFLSGFGKPDEKGVSCLGGDRVYKSVAMSYRWPPQCKSVVFCRRPQTYIFVNNLKEDGDAI